MCNLGAENAKGDFLLFLNDDIEVFQPEWLERMLGHAQREHIGAVGAKLFYPRSTLIQHAGVSCTEKEGPVHSYLFLDDQTPYYFGWNWVENNCSAVTGACLLIAKDKFFEVGGFDNQLAVAYNDVKLCFALHKKGYYNVIRNDVVAYHHESLSRGTDQDDDRKLIRLGKERTKLFSQFPALFKNDPYLNPHMARRSLAMELKWGYDSLSKMDVSDCLPMDDANIDFVTPGEDVKVIGWSVLKEEEHIEELERYLIVKDPFGNTYGARGLPFYRPDVVDHFKDERYAFSGFECVLNIKEILMEKMPYQFGIMTVARNGTRYLKWGFSTTVIRKPQPRPTPLAHHVIFNLCIHENSEDVQWSLDDCEYKDDYLLIRGFAYKRGDCHYQYNTSIILLENKGKAIECNTHQEERIDVAYSFIEEHFLRYTGFLCYIFEGVLEKGREYEVIIRLQNRFDPEDIRDVVTGRKITG